MVTETATQLGHYFQDVFGWNISILYDDYDRSRFLVGLRTTVELAVTCILLSILIGVGGAYLLGAPSRLVQACVRGYVQFFRNTPPLVQIYFFYFAVGSALPSIPDGFGGQMPPISNYAWAIISLSLFAGAFNIEIFRSGIEAIPPSSTEAAASLGFRPLQIFALITMPIAFRISLPALNNNLVNLVKTTSLAYAIGVPELMYATSQIYAEALNVREMMNVLLVCYVALVALLVWVMGRWERRMRMPGYGQ